MGACFEDSIIALQPELKRFAVSLVKDSDLANDLVQDTIYKALKFKNKWDATTNLRAWLYTILKNSFINEYRHNQKFQLVDISMLPHTSKSNDCPESSLNEKEIKELIANLNPIYREPFELHITGWKYEEIGEKLGVKLGTIKSRIFFARKKLMNNLIDNQLIITTMNDIAKTSIKDRLVINLEKEGLSKTKAGELLGVKAQYLSMVLSPVQWNKFPETTWEALQKWVNSGLSITKYGEKIGVLTSIPIQKEAKTVPEKKETVPETVKSEPEPLIKAKPEALEKRNKELAIKERRASRGEMVDMLIEEKEYLRAKIEAIDTLLKHYIS